MLQQEGRQRAAQEQAAGSSAPSSTAPFGPGRGRQSQHLSAAGGQPGRQRCTSQPLSRHASRDKDLPDPATEKKPTDSYWRRARSFVELVLFQLAGEHAGSVNQGKAQRCSRGSFLYIKRYK